MLLYRLPSLYRARDLVMSGKWTMTCTFVYCFQVATKTFDARRLYEVWVDPIISLDKSSMMKFCICVNKIGTMMQFHPTVAFLKWFERMKLLEKRNQAWCKPEDFDKLWDWTTALIEKIPPRVTTAFATRTSLILEKRLTTDCTPISRNAPRYKL